MYNSKVTKSLQKLHAGEPLRLSASSWNEIAKHVESSNNEDFPPVKSNDNSMVIICKNTTGSAIPAFTMVSLETPVVDANLSGLSQTYNATPTLGINPTEDSAIGITQEAIANGESGYVCVSGVSVLNLGQTQFKFGDYIIPHPTTAGRFIGNESRGVAKVIEQYPNSAAGNYVTRRALVKLEKSFSYNGMFKVWFSSLAGQSLTVSCSGGTMYIYNVLSHTMEKVEVSPFTGTFTNINANQIPSYVVLKYAISSGAVSFDGAGGVFPRSIKENDVNYLYYPLGAIYQNYSDAYAGYAITQLCFAPPVLFTWHDTTDEAVSVTFTDNTYTSIQVGGFTAYLSGVAQHAFSSKTFTTDSDGNPITTSNVYYVLVSYDVANGTWNLYLRKNGYPMPSAAMAYQCLAKVTPSKRQIVRYENGFFVQVILGA